MRYWRQGRLQPIATSLLGLSLLSSGCQTSFLTAVASKDADASRPTLQAGRQVYPGGSTSAPTSSIITVGRVVASSEETNSQPVSSGEKIATTAEPPLATTTDAPAATGSWHAIESTSPSQPRETPTGDWHPRPSMRYVETSMGVTHLDANTVRAVQVAQPEPNPAA